MTYEDSKELSKPKKKGYRVISEMSTMAIIFFLLRKHKTAIFATWAICMTIAWAFPQWDQMLGAILF